MINLDLKNDLQDIIDLHEKMKGCYFYNSPCNARSRRSYEKYNSLESSFEIDNNKIEVIQNTECSCKNVYYSMEIYINEVLTNKDIRFIKKLLKQLENKTDKSAYNYKANNTIALIVNI